MESFSRQRSTPLTTTRNPSLPLDTPHYHSKPLNSVCKCSQHDDVECTMWSACWVNMLRAFDVTLRFPCILHWADWCPLRVSLDIFFCLHHAIEQFSDPSFEKSNHSVNEFKDAFRRLSAAVFLLQCLAVSAFHFRMLKLSSNQYTIYFLTLSPFLLITKNAFSL